MIDQCMLLTFYRFFRERNSDGCVDSSGDDNNEMLAVQVVLLFFNNFLKPGWFVDEVPNSSSKLPIHCKVSVWGDWRSAIKSQAK